MWPEITKYDQSTVVKIHSFHHSLAENRKELEILLQIGIEKKSFSIRKCE